MGVWTGIGGTSMLLYLAGLSNVPADLIDAAQEDGALADRSFPVDKAPSAHYYPLCTIGFMRREEPGGPL